MGPETTVMKPDILKTLSYPIAPGDILRKRQALKKELLKQANLVPSRVAILGGSTTTETKSMLEIFLLAQGIEPVFYESGYNRYFEDVLFENADLWNFKPNIVFIHTTWQNISEFPALLESELEVEARVRREMARFESLWEKVHEDLGAVIIQNNFDLPRFRPMGNVAAAESFGSVNFVMRLNAEFAAYARKHPYLLLNDILYLSAQVGQAAWFRPSYWYGFHMALSPTASVALGQSVAAIVKSVYGKSKKCLVLDLDNTLWGGVIGDDGLQNLILGTDHPVGEAYLDFQRYVKNLQRRGVILAVCSKNDHENAIEGFSHPDSLLKLEDFSVFKANWNTKPENIREIAAELNIGLDSIVFVDDNPAERALVEEQLPAVAVPNVGSDISLFAEILEHERYFEVHKIVKDDLNRSAFYGSNAERRASQSEFSNYGDFLASLQMCAEIDAFCPVYLERITQLINKTNQFNLTTRRYTSGEVESIAHDPAFVTLYGRLTDKFGDNGLVSVVVGQIIDKVLQIDLWLMSCRVLKREMELAMFDALVEQCQQRSIGKIVGIYIPSKKNNMVAGHYASLGFSAMSGTPEGGEWWNYVVPVKYSPKTRYIQRTTGSSQTTEAAESAPVRSEV
jgi:FkbH-like protein